MLKPQAPPRARLPAICALAFASWLWLNTPAGAGNTSPLEQLMALNGVSDHPPASMDPITANLRTKYPDVPPALWDNYAARINDHAAFVRLYAPIYRRYLSEADIRKLVEFFQSPLGSRYTAALAQVARDTDADAQTWAVSVATDLLREKDAPSNAIPRYPETEQVRAVRELMQSSGARARAQAISAQLILRLGESGLDEVSIQRVRERLSGGDALLESWVPAYARCITSEDARAMSRFFRTPVGRRWAAAWPRIQDECLLAASDFAKEASRGAIREVLGPLPQWRLLHPVQPPPASPPSSGP